MKDIGFTSKNILSVNSFDELVTTTFEAEVNAICWRRELKGNFEEVVSKIELDENITELDRADLLNLQLSEEGVLARNILIHDLQLLQVHGASPVLNVISHYDRDETSFFPTDVYSFHVDRSPVPTDTFLCTYYGAPSEILANSDAEQKILVPEIRNQLKNIYTGHQDDFESFLSDNFFDLHHQPKVNAHPISLGVGHLWRLATDHPTSKVLPCIHRAPTERVGEKRLLLIC
jgi:hypothetical protein